MAEIMVKPPKPKKSLARIAEAELMGFLKEVVFSPILDMLSGVGVTPRLNAGTSAVFAALQSHSIQYVDGKFTGEFNAAVSRELRALGATFDKRQKAFLLPIGRVPPDMRILIAEAKTEFHQAVTQAMAVLSSAAENLTKAPTGMDLDEPVIMVVDDMDKQLGISGDYSRGVKEDLQKQYVQNLDLYIKDFVSERIPVIRQKIWEILSTGARAKEVEKYLEAEYGLAKNKASFIASQETSVFLSKFAESRYRSLGSTKYVWSTSGDSRVRHDHTQLEGKIFRWDDPPITNLATGARHNPGEDFGCRCVALPLMPEDEGLGNIYK